MLWVMSVSGVNVDIWKHAASKVLSLLRFTRAHS